MLSVEKVSNFLGDRKEEVVTTPLSENKSSTKDVDKGADELEYMKKEVVTTLLLEKKSSTMDFEKGTDELADTPLLQKKLRQRMLKKVLMICQIWKS